MQRRQQKLIEIAPSPSITPATRDQLVAAAMRMAQSVRYNSLGTFEFLVSTNGGEDATFAFIEANPRLQVEHTVTEAVTGVDLVKVQMQLAFGQSIRELGLDALHHEKPRGFAIELRVNTESMAEDASVRPSHGTINVFEAPTVGAKIDASDPLAILHLGKSAAPQVEPPAQDQAAQTLPGYDLEGVENAVALRAPMQGTIVSVDANEGDVIAQGQQLIVMEAMKMEHVIAAPVISRKALF